jgi:hypothetical protein
LIIVNSVDPRNSDLNAPVFPARHANLEFGFALDQPMHERAKGLGFARPVDARLQRNARIEVPADQQNAPSSTEHRNVRRPEIARRVDDHRHPFGAFDPPALRPNPRRHPSSAAG